MMSMKGQYEVGNFKYALMRALNSDPIESLFSRFCQFDGGNDRLDSRTAVFTAETLLKPLEQGIIRSVKQAYRKNLLRRMLLAMDSGKTYTIDLLGAIHLLVHSWREVQPATIQNCFARAQFKMFEGGGDDADGEDTQDCENLLVEVLERQGAADEEVNFGTFRDVRRRRDHLSGLYRQRHCCCRRTSPSFKRKRRG
ncbi:hypothetical protein MTO96_035734 [Rhipicephalus appendiculatus]